MFKYWWILLIGAIFAITGCQWSQTTDEQAIFPIQGISAYKGQSVSSLFNDNGAPNITQNLSDNRILWVYYTNYRPVGGGELISYDMPTQQQAQTTCTVQVIIENNTVVDVMENNC